MKRKVALFIGLVLTLHAGQTSTAQDRPAWLSQIEQALDKGEWRVAAKRFYVDSRSKKFLGVTIQLVRGEVNSTVDINLKPSPKEARAPLSGISTSPRAKPEVTVKNLPGVGEESVMLKDQGERRWTQVGFTKGKVFTFVMSSSEGEAKELARLVSDHLPEKD